jgi:choice-of-anchor B domain-containing protein
MKKFIHLAFGAALLLLLQTAASGQNFNLELRSTMDFPGQRLANIGGWTAPDGREYALVGASEGLVIVEVTNPDAPVQIVQIPGPSNNWKEIKTYKHYAYVTSEGGGGVQIVDLSALPSPALNYHHYEPVLDDNGQAKQLFSIHALHIDTTQGFLYVYGAGAAGVGRIFEGGAIVFDLNDDPFNPTYAGNFVLPGASGNGAYVHDGYVDNDTLYAGHIYAGLLSIVDMTDKANPVVLGSVQTPGHFTHNAWLTDDRTHVLTTDESFPSFVTAYDVTDPSDPQEVDRISTNDGFGSIGHNVHVIDDWAVTSWYIDGVVIIDAHKPDNLVITGRYDTYAGGGSFNGNWGAFPYFPSGTIVATNIDPARLFVFTPEYVRAAYVEGKVVINNPCSGEQLTDLSVTVTGGVPQAVAADGTFKTGTVVSGAVELTVSAPGFIPQTVPVTVTPGEVTVVDLALEAGPFITAPVTVTDTAAAPIANATLQLIGPTGSTTVQTDASGVFTFNCLPAGTYRVAGWGFLPETVLIMPDATSAAVTLEPGYYDDFEFDLGWESVDAAETGEWQLVVPTGTEGPQGLIAPGDDAANDNNGQAYVTENGEGTPSEFDVDNGQVTLISPSMDLSGADDAIVTFQYWFFNGGGNGTPNDQFEVRANNGLTTVTIFTETVSANNWRESGEINLADFLALTDDVRLEFITADQPQPDGHLVEAGVDVVSITPVITSGAGTPIDAAATLQAAPNPSTTHFSLDYSWKNAGGDAALEVRNIVGQVVYAQALTADSGRVLLGQSWPAGVYLAVLRSAKGQSAVVKLVKE